MNTPRIIISASLITCCALIEKHGASSVKQIAEMADMPQARISKIVVRGVELGYLKEGEKPERLGRGNRRKTYLRTKKKFPAAKIAPPPPPPPPPVKIVVFRHWQDEALFGPAPDVWTGSWQSKARVFRQPMTVTNDEMEVA